jgi:uncharacterized YigZ family protein
MTTRVVLTALQCSEQVIKKSRFIAIAGVVTSETEARDFIERHSVPSANHNCWAWRLGQTYRFNDDGEPSGTAGKPILQAMDGQKLDHTAVVVTRWFGGILLGSGGLMRAYGGTAAMCLREAEKVPLLDTVSATITCTFSDAALVYARLNALSQVQMLQQDFIADGSKLMISVEQTAADTIASLVSDLTSGRSSVTWEA